MYLILLSLFVAVNAAPHYHHGPNNGLRDSYFQNDLFDARKFWEDLSKELREFDTMMQDFYTHFPSAVSSERVDGNQYKVTVTLQGFEEPDIVVKAREGLLMIQAVHKTQEGNEKSYLDLRTLPSNVNVTGSWTYEQGLLTIVFPITGSSQHRPVTEPQYPQPEDRSREDIEPQANRNTTDEIESLNSGNDNSLDNNEIPRRSDIEATTYAVDFNNEVEFVPVRHNRY